MREIVGIDSPGDDPGEWARSLGPTGEVGELGTRRLGGCQHCAQASRHEHTRALVHHGLDCTGGGVHDMAAPERIEVRGGMRNVFTLKTGWALAAFALLDMVCVGLGMGVPIFCILFGLPVGWYITMRIAVRPVDTRRTLSRMLLGAVLTSAVTFVAMVLVWGRCILMLFDPTADLANFGIPLILFDPVASFVGWLVLMIIISPFLQLLMTLFGSHMTLLWWLSRSHGVGEAEPGPALAGAVAAPHNAGSSLEPRSRGGTGHD
jgi:hypothetical protein